MLSLDLCQISRPKMSFFVRQIMHISSQILYFVKNQYFCHDSQFSSFRQFFVKNESFGAYL